MLDHCEEGKPGSCDPQMCSFVTCVCGQVVRDGHVRHVSQDTVSASAGGGGKWSVVPDDIFVVSSVRNV